MNFHPPPPPHFQSLLLSFFFSYPSSIEIIFDFSDIITKIHPPFQNPGSTLGPVPIYGPRLTEAEALYILYNQSLCFYISQLGKVEIEAVAIVGEVKDE